MYKFNEKEEDLIVTYYMHKETRQIVELRCKKGDYGKKIEGWLFCDGTEGTLDLREINVDPTLTEKLLKEVDYVD